MVIAQLIGNPFTAKGIYARNVWDMQVFDGKIFLGHGNSSNTGPSGNAGPIPIYALDPLSGTFTNEYSTENEQIDVFRVIDGVLWTTAHDPRGNASTAPFYRQANGTWAQTTNPGELHNYDIASHGGALFVALGNGSGKPTARSTNGGISWVQHGDISGRIYELFKFKGVLYGMTYVDVTEHGRSIAGYGSVFYWNGTTMASVDTLRGIEFMPGAPTTATQARTERTLTFNNRLIYLGVNNVNDHQWEPFALYTATVFGTGTKVDLGAGTLPYDLLVRGGTLYVLASKRNALGDYENIVYSSTNSTTLSEFFRFASTTLARSFEELNGDFYFGLGTDTTELDSNTGNIYKVGAVQRKSA
jgi:hypothetical protein